MIKIKKKYRKSLIIFLAIIIPLVMFTFIPIEGNAFLSFLPNSMGLQIGYIFWMSALAGIIGILFIGYLFAPIFLFAYKYTVGIRMTFGIQERPESKKLKIPFKALYPALMALHIALIFATNEGIQDLLISATYVSESQNQAFIPMATAGALIPLTFGIAMGIFSPIWFLLESGIVFTNKDKVRGMRDPIEVRSVGGWYHYLLKGYAGISVIVGYIVFIGKILEVGNFNPGMILMVFLPVIMICMAIPGFIILDMTNKHRQKFMRKIARRFGISGPLENPLDIKAE
jgi:hypothetical protein